MKKYLIYIVFIAFHFTSYAQFRINGNVIDVSTNMPLYGAQIYLDDSGKGTTSDTNGNFKLQTKNNLVKLRVNYLGYQDFALDTLIKHDATINIYLIPTNLKLDEVKIEGTNKSRINGSLFLITGSEIEQLPSFLGETDVIRTVKLSPGIQSASEGNSGIFVRGSGPGQNLILIDDIPLYNPSHLLGMFSVFNSDIVKSVNLYKSNFPAKYGGRASSVLSVSLLDQLTDTAVFKGSIGILSSKFSGNLPLNNKINVLFSIRRSYIDWIQEGFSKVYYREKNVFNETRYYFLDGNLKVNLQANENNKFEFSAYKGIDDYSFLRQTIDFENKMNWGNTGISLKWIHSFSENSYLTNQIGYSGYIYGIDAGLKQFSMELESEIENLYYNLNFSKQINNKHIINAGAQLNWHKVVPSSFNANASEVTYESDKSFFGADVSLYAEGNWKIGEKLQLITGVRATQYAHIGPYTYYFRDESGALTDSSTYNKNEQVQTFIGIDPRFSFVYNFNTRQSVNLNISRANQFMHLVTVGSVSFPTDLWMPSTEILKPEINDMVSMGIVNDFADNMYTVSSELYYKKMYNLIEFKSGFIMRFDNDNIEESMTTGEGRSYGLELFAKKNLGKLTGWLSYTLSKTERKFAEFNENRYYPAKYDRPHEVTLTANYKLNKAWSFSGIFILASGNAMTLPVGRYMIEGNIVNDYSEVNSFRMPAYHRLDISASYKVLKNKKYESSWNFGIYNVYNRKNPFFIFFESEGNLDEYELRVKAEEIPLYPILPSISWNFKF